MKPALLLLRRHTLLVFLSALCLLDVAAWAAAPAVPTALSVSTTTAPDGQRGFMMRWVDNSNDEDFFIVYVRVGTSGAFVRTAFTTKRDASDISFYATKSFAVGTEFQFTVAAGKGVYNSDRQLLADSTGFPQISAISAQSGMKSTTWPDLPSSFGAPTGIAGFDGKLAVELVGDGKLRFRFVDNADTEARFQVQMRPDPIPTSTPQKTEEEVYNETALPFSADVFWHFNLTDKTLPVFGLEPGKKYAFRIRAVRTLATGSTLSPVTAWLTSDAITMPPLVAPTDFTATSPAELRLNFTWKDNSDNEELYLLQQRTGTAAYPTDGSDSPLETERDRTSDTFFPIAPGTREWRVSAAHVTRSGTAPSVTSAYNLAPSATTVSLTTTFNAPTSPRVVSTDNDPDSNATSVVLEWQDNSFVEDGFEIQTSITGATGTYTTLTSIGDNQASAPSTMRVTLNTLPAGGTVHVKVRAFVFGPGSTRITSDSTAPVSVETKNTILGDANGDLNPPATKGTAITSYAILTSQTAAATMTVEGLPPGLTFASSTNTITGTPTAGGLYRARVLATFTGGTQSTEFITFRVVTESGPPVSPTGTYSQTRTIARDQEVLIPMSELLVDHDTPAAVRMMVQRGDAAAPEPLDMILYSDLTPQTYANFMAYVQAGDLNGTLFHRASASPIVLQGGGYRRLPDPELPDLFATPIKRSSPPNEPGIPNAKGTIAMAKTGGDANSATSEFYFNIGDNSGGLDPVSNNGGFTTFGRIARFTGTSDGPFFDLAETIHQLTKTTYNLKLRDQRGGGVGSSPSLSDFPITAPTTASLEATPATVPLSRLVTIKSIVPIENLLTFTGPSVTGGSAVNATLTEDKRFLRLRGNALGTGTVTLKATDIEGNVSAEHTINVTVSDPATFQHPLITKHPVNATVADGGSTSLTVNAVGTGLSYQWLKDGAPVPTNGRFGGATSPTLDLTNAAPEDKGIYSVVVSNAATSVTSNVAVLTVLIHPVITRHPTSLTRDYGSTAVFSVIATGTAPLTYQWKKGGVPIEGVNSNVLVLSPVLRSDAGDYTVEVSNGIAENANSAPAATLTVNVYDTDQDGLDDDVEDTNGSNKFVKDSDGDGYEDGLETKLGTSPKLKTSHPGIKNYVAAKDAESTLRSIQMQRVREQQLPTGSALLPGAPLVRAYWLAATELTNVQWAAVLQRAYENNLVDLPLDGARRYVRYPKGSGGRAVCYLEKETVTVVGDITPPACEVRFNTGWSDTVGQTRFNTFLAPLATQALPARAISWEGAYLATVVLNQLNGYTEKNSTIGMAFNDYDTSSNVIPGYSLPSFDMWQSAARGFIPENNFITPVGNVPSLALAWYQQLPSAALKPALSFRPNAFGVYGLAGNVAEWVREKNTDLKPYTCGGGYSDVQAKLSNGDKTAVFNADDLKKHIGVRLALDGPAAPTITQSPKSQIVFVGQPLTLTAAATGAPALAWQWLHTGKVLAGQASSTLSLPAAALTSAGSYVARVTSNKVQPRDTTPALINVVQVPAITRFDVKTGSTVTLKVPYSAAPGAGLRFQWYAATYGSSGQRIRVVNSGSFITGSQTNTLTMLYSQPIDSGSFSCVISTPDITVEPVEVFFQVRVLRNPEIVSTPQFPGAVVSGNFLYQLDYERSDITRTPSKFTATGLPLGLSINATTGLISGKPLVSGVFNVVITASNAYGVVSSTSSVLVVQGLIGEGEQPIAVGRFFGIIDRSSRLTNFLGGVIDITVQKNGTFTGQLTLGATVQRISGALNTSAKDPTQTRAPNPTASFVIPRTGKTPLGLSFEINLDERSQLLTGTLSELTSDGRFELESATVGAGRVRWIATDPAVDYVGPHTIALDIPTRDIGNQELPQGSGFGSVTVNALGATSMVGKLADGTPFTFAGALGPNGELPLFQSLYKGKGSVLGTMSMSAGLYNYITGVDSVSWFKAAHTVSTTDRTYIDGFYTFLTPVGGLYTPVVAPSIVMGLGFDGASQQPSPLATITFTDGSLTTAQSESFNVKAPALTVMPTTNPKKLSCTILNGTGNVSGNVTIDTIATPYQGMIVIDPLNPGKGTARGYFLRAASVAQPILSGRVEINAAAP